MEVEKAFEALKNELTSDDLLVYPKFDRSFLVTCDASDTALRGIVSQLDDQQRERLVRSCSSALKGAEQNYSTLDREALAIKFTLDRNRFLLLGHEITMQSDHQPLKYLFNKSNLNSWQSRWLEAFMKYNIIGFEYLPGKANKVTDALSRPVPSENSNSAHEGRFVNVLMYTEAAKLATPSHIPLSEVQEVDHYPCPQLEAPQGRHQCLLNQQRLQ